MKLVIRTITALAVLGVASPALPCPAHQTTTAEAQPAQQPTAAKDKDTKQKVTKSEKAKKQQQKGTQDQKAATAVN